MVGYTDYFLIASGRSDRQTRAIHDGIHSGMKERYGLLPRRVEGLGESRWILMDYLDVVVHIFTPETREYYRLEQLWGGGPPLALPDLPEERRLPQRRHQLRRDLFLAAHDARQLDRAVALLGPEAARYRGDVAGDQHLGALLQHVG